MSATRLKGRRIAVLATDGFEQDELVKPRDMLLAEGAEVVVVSLKAGTIQGMKHDVKGELVKVDAALNDCDASKFDGLVLPGGLANPDALRVDQAAVDFVRAFVTSAKPIAAICHGPWTLIEAGGVKGKTVTSWPSLRTDLTNAGAMWVDQAVSVDGSLVTSRKPSDIPAFVEQAVTLFARERSPARS